MPKTKADVVADVADGSFERNGDEGYEEREAEEK